MNICDQKVRPRAHWRARPMRARARGRSHSVTTPFKLTLTKHTSYILKSASDKNGLSSFPDTSGAATGAGGPVSEEQKMAGELEDVVLTLPGDEQKKDYNAADGTSINTMGREGLEINFTEYQASTCIFQVYQAEGILL